MSSFARTSIAFVIALLGTLGAARAADAPAVDPAATDALKRMGVYLRSLMVFQVQADTTDEDVLLDGQKIQYTGTARILAQQPNKFRAEASNDRRDRVFLYDGKTFALVAPRVNYYSTMPAPANISQLAAELDKDYGFSIPLRDLFSWGTAESHPEAIKGATVVGPSAVEGTTCMQYAFRQEDADWQVWIQRGDFPLPRRLVITLRTDDALPQHTAVLTWNLAPSFNAATFRFEPGPGLQRVALTRESFEMGTRK